MTFLRLDPPELTGTNMVVRAVPADARALRRSDPHAPFAYLYEQPPPFSPEEDIVLAAGHYDEVNLVWSFSGEIHGITGITEPRPSPESLEGGAPCPPS
ncbi:hypothetical protein SAMN04489712_111230 [Thermomonospora echinospora]|uniref:Uncharacterized protein n=1 Tax=Thermomonospora echinospora TaxID=1992 RepID=A0A1H6CW78_9ACTN|nr:hypothetical protein [Thermomonospora echinospora]SEG76963.1 hypothetical protein SAMN04489712_111230 [Thermomonospora echinospora]